MTSQELQEIGQKLFKAGRYVEAAPLLKSAAEAFPHDEQLWRELVLSSSWSGQHEQAAEFAKRAIGQHPRSDWLWRQLGSELIHIGQLDNAEKALSNAQSLNPNAEWLWRYLATLHREQKNPEREIEALENLNMLGAANATDLWYLGLAYSSQRNFARALECYRLSARSSSDPALLTNIGLVFNNPEVECPPRVRQSVKHWLIHAPIARTRPVVESRGQSATVCGYTRPPRNGQSAPGHQPSLHTPRGAPPQTSASS